MIRFVVHYHFEPLIQQLFIRFIRVSNLSLLWAVDSLCHTPWVHLSNYFPTHWGISAPSVFSSITSEFVKQSDPFHTFENLLHPNVGSLMYNVYLSVPLPGWLFRTSECWRARGQTIQNWNPVRSSNIDHAAGNLRVITWRTSMGPWTLLVIK
jgi:hypothetical protein